MIKSFKCRETEKIYNREFSKKIPYLIQRVAMRKLWMIDSAINIGDLKIPPANHLERLCGNREEQYSIRINKQWRICFCWQDNDAYDVEIIDYH